MKQTFRYSLTYENPTGPTRTLTGTVSSSATQSAVRYAVLDAKSQTKGERIRWTSMVVVLEKAEPEA